MYSDKVSAQSRDSENMGLLLKNDFSGNIHMTGEYTDRIFKNGVLKEEIHGHNLVVEAMLPLVMSLLKNSSSMNGIQYWAVGSGSDLWSEEDIPTPSLTDTKLVDEIGRVPVQMISFYDSEAEEVTDKATNVLEIRAEFREEDCNGVWREFGVFGGNATSNPNSGIMINKRNHPILTKTSEMLVQRVLRFTLSLV